MSDYEDNLQEGETTGRNGKQIIATKVTGKVKWYNVKKGYGFIHRDDIDEDVFVHQTAIIRVQPGCKNKSLGDDEDVEFDVVKGMKGSEAIRVTGPRGEAVRGSIYASASSEGGAGGYGSYSRGGVGRDSNMNDNNGPFRDYNIGGRGGGSYRGRGSYRGGQQYGSNYGNNSEDNNDGDDNNFGGEVRPRGGRGGRRAQFSNYQNNESRDFDYGNEDRGRGGYGRSRGGGGRGGPRGGRGGGESDDSSGFRGGRRPSRRNYGRGN